MTRWPAWVVALVCVGYMLALTAASAAWKYRHALAEVRRQGYEPEQLYLAVQPKAWWYALLVLPPLALLAWQAYARRGV